MSQNGWISIRELCITSDPTAGKQAIDELLAQLEQLCWEENDVFGVHLAVEEAVVNAIKHGNRYDTTKQVRIVYKFSPTHLRVEIGDEGDGFNPADVPDPTDDENLESPSGRGLMLMHSFMCRVEYNERGNQVIMEKRRSNS